MSSIRSILEDFLVENYNDRLSCETSEFEKCDKYNIDQALKDISELIDGAKPETQKIAPVFNDEETDRIINDIRGGYNTGIDEYQSNLKELLK